MMFAEKKSTFFFIFFLILFSIPAANLGVELNLSEERITKYSPARLSSPVNSPLDSTHSFIGQQSSGLPTGERNRLCQKEKRPEGKKKTQSRRVISGPVAAAGRVLGHRRPRGPRRGRVPRHLLEHHRASARIPPGIAADTRLI